MASSDLQVRFRLPEDLKEWLRKQAEQNVRSMNGEVVALLNAARRSAESSRPSGGAPAAGEASQA
jgi:hypothetical protein